MSSTPFDREKLSELSPEVLAEVAADCLALLEPGRQPLPLFTQFARHVTLSTFEVTPFRESRTGTEVLLSLRSETDAWWPGQWHLPGSVILPAKQPGIRRYEDFADEILGNEFASTVRRIGNVSLFDAQPRTGLRGSEQTVFGWANVDLTHTDVEPYEGRFFDVDTLLSDPPKGGLVEGHELTIIKALADRALN